MHLIEWWILILEVEYYAVKILDQNTNVSVSD